MTPVEKVLTALDWRGSRVKKKGSYWVAQCRAHDDKQESLSVSEADDGKALVKCHAGCSYEAIRDSLSMEDRDFFPDDGPETPLATAEPKPKKPAEKSEIVAEYDYTDEEGELLFQAVRLEPKSFRQRRPKPGGGWDYSLGETRRVLYRLPRIVEAVEQGKPVWIVEGEKDVHALEALGLVATCNPMGAGKWLDAYGESLVGCKGAVIVGDCDEPGRAHAEHVARALHDQGILAKVVDLDPKRDDKYDVGDLIAEKGAEAARRYLIEYARRAKPWTDADAKDGVVAVDLAAIERTETRWLVEDRVPIGSLTLLVGDPGEGKSMLTCLWAALLSRGKLKGAFQGEPQTAILVNGEDTLASTIIPRLEAVEADLEGGHVIALKKRVQGMEESLLIPNDIREIERQVIRTKAKLLIIDPLTAHLPQSINSWQDQSVRLALAPLYRLAERREIAVVAVMHMSKDQTKKAMLRVGGSVGFPGAARSVLVFGAYPEGSDMRALAHAKTNLGPKAPTVVYAIDAIALPPKGNAPMTKTAKLTYVDTITASAEEVLSGGADE